jgi:hypothetical protein
VEAAAAVAVAVRVTVQQSEVRVSGSGYCSRWQLARLTQPEPQLERGASLVHIGWYLRLDSASIISPDCPAVNG